MFRGQLIDRNTILEAAGTWMRNRREVTCLGRMSPIDLRMTEGGKYREVIATFINDLRVRRGFISAAGLLRKQVRAVNSERGANSDHAALWSGRTGSKGGNHRVQHWQCQGHTCAL